MVDKNVLATAWGISGCVLGLSQMIMPLIFIQILDPDNLLQSYSSLIIFVIVITLIKLTIALVIKCGKYEKLDRVLTEQG